MKTQKKAHLDEGAYDAKRVETKVFKGTRFGSRIQERIKKQRYVRYYVAFSHRRVKVGEVGREVSTVQEELSRLGMRCDALKESESVADTVRYMRGEVRRREHGIDRHDLLEESRHDT